MTLGRLLIVLLVAGCAAQPAAPAPEGGAVIHVIARGWHTDIGLPVEEITGPLATLERAFPGVRYLVFGFGERAFFMSRRTDSGEMLAALLPSGSTILMTALRASPTQAFDDEEVVTLRVRQADVDVLTTQLWQMLDKQPDGSVRALGPGPYLGSMFYASQPTYDLFNTCNTWTAEMLRVAGLPVDARLVLFASQVMGQVRYLAAMQGSAGRGGAVGADD